MLLTTDEMLNAIHGCEHLPQLEELMTEQRRNKDYVPAEVKRAYHAKVALLLGDGQTGEVPEDAPGWM